MFHTANQQLYQTGKNRASCKLSHSTNVALPVTISIGSRHKQQSFCRTLLRHVTMLTFIVESTNEEQRKALITEVRMQLAVNRQYRRDIHEQDDETKKSIILDRISRLLKLLTDLEK